MKNLNLLLLAVLMLSGISMYAQVAINTDGSNADPSAILDVKCDTAGLLLPRMTEAERNAISNPAAGLMIYQTDDTTGFYKYDGSAWVVLGAEAFAINDLADGITKNESVYLGENSGILDNAPITANVGVGKNALTSNVQGQFNVALGNASMASNTSGSLNVAVGNSGMYQNETGHSNTSIGCETFYHNISGNYNVAVGLWAGAMNETGDNNTYIGNFAGGAGATDRSGNVCIGAGAGARDPSSNKLFIDNSDTTRPLIWGDFANDTLRVNGILDINEAYSFPKTDGSSGQVLTTDGLGAVSWTSALASIYYTEIRDADDDTKVQVEKNADEDKIRFDIGGWEAMVIDSSGILAEGTFGSGNDVPVTGAGTRMMWYPKKASFRAGSVSSNQWDEGNIGEYSVAFGYNNTVSGHYSMAVGYDNTATAEYSVAMGYDTRAGHYYSTSMGYMTEASGQTSTALGMRTEAAGMRSVAMGYETDADARECVALGRFNVGGGDGVTWQEPDPVFEIGIGTSEVARANAVTVLKNGRVGIGTASPAGILDIADEYWFPATNGNTGQVLAADVSGALGWVDAASLVPNTEISDADGDTKVQVEKNADEDKIRFDVGGWEAMVIDSSGILSVGAVGSGTSLSVSGSGTRMFWYPNKAAFRAGRAESTEWDDANIGLYSMGLGYGCEASGEGSVAMGLYSDATGDNSVALGEAATASGDNSTAMGYGADATGDNSVAAGLGTNATGENSTAMGYFSDAIGDRSIAMGSHAIAESYISFAIGRYNVGGGNATSWVSTDPLFEIGNGSITNQTNAFTVLKNGSVGIGTSEPAGILDIAGEYYFPSTDGSSGEVLTTDGSGVVSWATVAVPTYFTEIRDTDNDTKVQVEETADEDIIRFDVAGTESMIIDGSGIIAAGTFGSGDDLGITGNGTRMIWYPKKASFRAGFVGTNQWDNPNIGLYSVAMGYITMASGNQSVALGGQTIASGANSLATGDGSDATGNSSTALGSSTTASGLYSTATGRQTQAAGEASTSMGYGGLADGNYATSMSYNTSANSYASVAIGRYNVGGGTSNAWNSNDPLFEIGIGTAMLARENALTVLKNGNVGIGLISPQRVLHVKDVMRLEPRDAPPPSASAGDLYFDIVISKLRCFDGSTWQDCW